MNTKSQFISVIGVGTQNKGAELMFLAIQEHLRGFDSSITLVADPWFGPYPDRASHGLHTKLSVPRLGRSWLAARLMPASFRAAYGLADESDIDAVIDASGFAFSDQFGPQRTEQFARDVLRWKKQGKKVILLPQALGPFKTERIRKAFRIVLDNADLIFARDAESLRYAQEVGGAGDRLLESPDFTNLVTAVNPGDVTPLPNQVCIVPNDRMIEKGGDAAKTYLPFMADCVKHVLSAGGSPLLLLHDPKSDGPLVEPLMNLVGGRIPVIRHPDPRHLKWILGASRLVIGSRFHALVSALSQAVPCLATGWSHKYQALFEDYGCPECVLRPQAGASDLRAKIEELLADAGHDRMTTTLRRNGDQLKDRVRRMWNKVDSVLGLIPGGGQSR